MIVLQYVVSLDGLLAELDEVLHWYIEEAKVFPLFCLPVPAVDFFVFLSAFAVY